MRTVMVRPVGVCLLSLLSVAALAEDPTLVIAKAFKKLGLESAGWKPLHRKDMGLAPFVHSHATRFLIPSLGKDAGGRIFRVPDVKGRDRLAAYYRELGKSSAAFYSHVFVKKKFVLQISGDLEDSKAAKYRKVFEAAVR
jgi:hypothetical protein